MSTEKETDRELKKFIGGGGTGLKNTRIRGLLVLYDLLLWIVNAYILPILHPSENAALHINDIILCTAIGAALIFICRFFAKVYNQIWRYGSIDPYIRLILADIIGCILYCISVKLIKLPIRIILAAFISAADLITAITVRMLYSHAYKYASRKGTFSDLTRLFLHVFANVDVKPETIDSDPSAKINAAVIGAGHIGTELARQLVENPMSQYRPVCFVDIDKEKIGRSAHGLPILGEAKNLDDAFSRLGVREIIFALPEMESVDKMALFDKYKHYGLKMNSYDYPIYEDDQSGKKRIREFTIEDLLQRPPVQLDEDILKDCYLGRRVLVTGGGGSIGSEMCRQIASMKPALLIIMDIAENTAYDLQQELRIQYGKKLKLAVEICNMCDAGAMDRLFAKYHPEVVIHAAAHKHVPLMEHNSTECIKNNVFGTQNTIDCCLKYGAQHFIMVSTDKAVNPTNVMGASKRVCELIAHNAADNTKAYAKSRGIRLSRTKTIFSATRFGNVLGSAGSVVPLFKRQIAAGGPITITDKNIIRYFMTIPEASKLVLTSGAIAKNGELFVLDMGEPVHIMTLAENMVRLSGLVPYRDIEIIETGLRPGEKLFEELLVADGNCTKTDNDLIYVEKEEPVDNNAVLAGLADLAEACENYDDEAIRGVLKEMVPTYTAQKE